MTADLIVVGLVLVLVACLAYSLWNLFRDSP